MSVIDDILDEYRFEFADAITLSEIQNSIRRRCPGEYALQCSYVKPDNTVNVDITFLYPEDAVAFKLKYQ